MVSVLNFLLGNHISGNNSLSTAQLELLLCLSRQRVDLPMGQAWNSLAGPMEHNIARFVSEGLLEEASVEEKIDARFKASELRQMLEDRGIKARAKKQEMIATLVCSMPQAEAETLVSGVRMFRLTEQGNRVLESYRSSSEKAREEMEQETIALLLKGDVKKAWARIGRYNERLFSPNPRWSRMIPGSLACEAKYLLRKPYDDLPLDAAGKNEIGARLALSVLLGETFEETGRRIAVFLGPEFDWASVLAFHRPSPCGAAGTDDSDTLSTLYATTRIHEALANCDLASLKEARLGKGIKILPVHSADCHVCHSGKFTYAWSEMEQLPKLPRQIGCHCTYSAWL